MATFQTKSFLKHDDYMTPKYAWENINQYIPKDKIIWESFVGDGKSGEYLRELGCNVIHDETIDFFEQEPPNWDLIVSNPPFSKVKDVLKRLLILDKPFIMIMPCSKINTSYMRDWKNKLQIIIPKKRIHFEKHINGEKPEKWRNACNFECFYYCYKMNLPKDIVWLD